MIPTLLPGVASHGLRWEPHGAARWDAYDGEREVGCVMRFPAHRGFVAIDATGRIVHRGYTLVESQAALVGRLNDGRRLKNGRVSMYVEGRKNTEHEAVLAASAQAQAVGGVIVGNVSLRWTATGCEYSALVRAEVTR